MYIIWVEKYFEYVKTRVCKLDGFTSSNILFLSFEWNGQIDLHMLTASWINFCPSDCLSSQHEYNSLMLIFAKKKIQMFFCKLQAAIVLDSKGIQCLIFFLQKPFLFDAFFTWIIKSIDRRVYAWLHYCYEGVANSKIYKKEIKSQKDLHSTRTLFLPFRLSFFLFKQIN